MNYKRPNFEPVQEELHDVGQIFFTIFVFACLWLRFYIDIDGGFNPIPVWKWIIVVPGTIIGFIPAIIFACFIILRQLAGER